MGLRDIIFLILEANWNLIRLIFFFVPTLLVLFSLSLVILTLCLWCKKKEKIQYKVLLRFILIIYLIITSAYAIGIINDINKLGEASFIEVCIIIAGVLAPICIMVVGKWLMNLTIKGVKIFNPIVLFILYIIICIIWEIFFPDEIRLIFAILFAISLGVCLHYILSKGGDLGK